MTAKSLAIFLGALWTPFYGHAAENNPPPATNSAPAVEVKPAAPAAGTTVPATGKVTRALFTSDIKDREPVDNIATLSNDKTRVVYFTEIQDMAGQTVMHRWEYNGKVMAEMPFHVGTARWRIYSTKTLDPSWLGEWKASVVDAAGGSLSVNTFSYMQKAGAAPALSAPATPAQF